MNNLKYDCVIIGGGIIGLCSAYYLQKSGLKVAIIEKNTCGQGSSFGNAGYISPSHFIPLAAPGVFTQGLKWMFNPKSPLYIKPTLKTDMFLWTFKFAKSCRKKVMLKSIPILRDLLNESRAKLLEIDSQLKLKTKIDKRGLVILYNTEKGYLSCKHEHELGLDFGVESILLNSSELKSMDPDIEFNSVGGLFFPKDMHLKPDDFVNELMDHLKTNGVSIFENCVINDFEITDSKIISMETSAGKFMAQDYVCAAGSWSSDFLNKLGLKMHLQPGKGYSVTVKNPGVKPKLPYIFLERRVAITPFSDSLRFAGTMEFSGMNTNINWSRVNAILDSVPHYFSNVQRPEALKHDVWAGLRPVSPDGLPYIGRYKNIQNLIAATGHAMLGLSLAPITGSIVSDIVKRQKSEFELNLLSPDRFS